MSRLRGARRRLSAAAAMVVLAAPLAAPVAAQTGGESELREAIAASREAFDDGAASGAVLARADEIADARAGSPLAEAVGGPLLLTHPDELASQTAAELQRVLPGEATVHLLGGPAAVSPGVADAVRALGFDVVRHGGATRFDTARAIAHAVAGLREFAIEEVDARDHPREVVVRVSRPVALADAQVPADAWSLTENGEERPARLVDTGSEDLAVMLAVDVSDTTGAQALAAAREATAGFVNQMPPEARIGVVAAGQGQARLLQVPTADHQAVRAALQALQPVPGGGLHDALARSLEQVADAEVPAVVVLSDGAADAADTDDTLEMVRDAGVTVHVVELLTGDGDPQALRALATAGGGRRVPAGDPAALAPLYDDLAYDLVGPQRLVYTSRAGGDTELAVTVDHGGVHAEASITTTLPEQPASVSPSWWASDTGLLVGAALVFLGLAVVLLALLAPRKPASQLAGARDRPRADRRDTALAGISDRLVTAADEALRRRNRRGAINQALERAGLALRPGELVVLTGCAAVVAFAVGLLLGTWWVGLVLAALAVLAVKISVSAMATRRQQRFTEQLSDTLQVLAGGLRSGHGLQQALHAAAQEADAPTSEELNRVVVETRLGRDLMEALRAMAQRMGSEDFDWVVQAVDIQREVGGDLAEVLDTVAATVRERARIRRQVKSLSAEGRLSAWILFALPFAMAGFLFVTNPAYIGQLTSSGLGWAMLAIGAGLLLVGGLWLRKLVDLQY